MKKIGFNDKYGLTQAVLEGRKTMTRRIIKGLNDDADVSEWGLDDKSPYIIDYNDPKEKEFRPRYQLGEVIAIAQPYKDVPPYKGHPGYSNHRDLSAGWKNKMFVKANLMPHFIKITNVKVERLQDCSEDDCLKEGIRRCNLNKKFAFDDKRAYNTAREAFAALIDKVSNKGTWQSNLWCFCYEFKLID